jgi:hypothetical protein
LRDGEYDFAIGAYSHTIARFEGGATPVETRMQASVYYKHRPRLRRQVRLRALFEKCLCFGHDCATGGYVEDPIRLHMKIAIAGRGAYTDELAPLFYVKAHRLEGRIEHAGVGGEQQLDRLMFQSSWQTSTSFPKFESYQAA